MNQDQIPRRWTHNFGPATQTLQLLVKTLLYVISYYHIIIFQSDEPVFSENMIIINILSCE